MKLDVKLTIDYVFKRVFGSPSSEPILLELLNAFLGDRLPPITSVVIVSPFDPKQFDLDHLAILDVKAMDAEGRQYDVEMQSILHPSYAERAVYDAAGMVRGQLLEGMDYSELKTCFGVHFVDDMMFPNHGKFHWKFSFRDRDLPQVQLSELSQIDVVELPKFAQSLNDLADTKSKWCYLISHSEQIDPDQLPSDFRTPAISQAIEVLKVITQNDQERDIYEARLKYERDERARTKGSFEKGLQVGKREGLLEGIREGRQEGIREGMFNTVRELVDFRFGFQLPASIRGGELDLDTLIQLKSLARTAQSLDEFRAKASEIGISIE